jgi:soluble lytic murein transglycosylase-like protein
VPARAELVFFTSGRTMSVKAHRVEADQIVLEARAGGEITCDRSIIARIEPDEVPYPEPVDEVRLKPDATTDSLKLDAREDSSGVRLQADHSEYDEIIKQASAEHGVDARLVHAVIQVESGYQLRARSPKGAMGLMQLMPATARQYSLADPYEPAGNIRAGIQHLKSLLERFPLTLALAAYNAGEATVERFRGMPPYPETRNYVQQILQLTSR